MTISILAAAPAAAITSGREPGYQLTVKVPSYPFGTSTLGISITTANGYTDQASIAASGVTSWTFNIPASQGSSVRVCVNSDNSSGENCNTYNTTGADMSLSLSPPSGNNNGYYNYPGNSYYIYPSNRYDNHFHHGGDHGFGGHQDSGNIGSGGHQDSGNGFGGHQDSGNIGSGGHQDSGNGFGGHQDSGNIGSGGHQDSGNGFGGHQDSGNIGSGGHQDSGNGFGGHQDRGNHKVAELDTARPSLGTTNVTEDDQ